MASQDNTSTISITSLPDEVLKLILQNVDWKTIYCVRLLSRFFNSFVLANLNMLPKPRLMGLNVSSFEEANGSLKISYKLTNSIKVIDNETFYFPLESVKIKKLEEYFKRMDLSNLVSMHINITGKTIIFDIINKYFKHETKVYYLKLFIDKNQSFDSFSSFIQKMKYVTHFHIKKICFHNQTIPVNFTLPMVENMRKMSILECECTQFVNPEMINNLFLNNKELLKMEILSKCYNYEVDLLKNIRNRQDICTGHKNCHNDYFVGLSHQSVIDAYMDVMTFFSCGTYNIVYDAKKIGRFNAYKQCSKCNYNKCITFQYYKSYTRRNDTSR